MTTYKKKPKPIPTLTELLPKLIAKYGDQPIEKTPEELKQEKRIEFEINKAVKRITTPIKRK